MIEMAKYLLDTDICIAMFKNRGGVRAKIIEVGRWNCCVSDITLAELYYGAAKSERPEYVDDVAFIVSHFEILPIHSSLARYGQTKWMLQKQGCPLDDFDLLIGTSAVEQDLIMVTHNQRHYARIPNIQLEDWIVG